MATTCRETVVDGYNLIHKLWDPGNGESMISLRERTEAILSAYRRKTRRHVTMVYDGGAGPRPLSVGGAIEIMFSGSALSADRWIIDHIRSMGSRADLISVVSSDHEIRRHVIAWGGQWKSSEAFIEELSVLGILKPDDVRKESRRSAAGSLKNGSMQISDDEVARWLLLFGKEK
ncbi:MAG: NYN domain-containing protein [Chlorobiaceae bacterium]|nr:NYN domain-containing protein [Chlorobiaceae bacterium]